jgi:hypothetical protein
VSHAPKRPSRPAYSIAASGLQVEQRGLIASDCCACAFPATLRSMGNLALLKGAHHAVEGVFQEQARAGGPLGPGGPGWEREDPLSPTTHGVNMMPPSVRDQFRINADGEAGIVTEKGRVWPRPTLVHASPGDTVFVLNHTPHAPTYIVREVALRFSHCSCNIQLLGR